MLIAYVVSVIVALVVMTISLKHYEEDELPLGTGLVACLYVAFPVVNVIISVVLLFALLVSGRTIKIFRK